jgi:dTDP-4-amino-4,6-dideoxygalactose transaminase
MTTAEGGMVITNSEKVYSESKLLREHGMSGAGAYDYTVLGFNYRMTNIEAAIGLGQLEKLENFNKARMKNAMFYNENLGNLDWLQIPFTHKDGIHCYHQYTLKVKDRDRFAEHLKVNEVGHKVFYPAIIPDAPMYQKMGYSSSDYPVAKKLCDEVISIPVHPSLTKEDREKVVEVIRAFKPAMSYKG